jgi:dihydroorotase
MDSVSIVRPDDWHLHLRDGDHLKAVVSDSASQFVRVIVMPNLRPPVTTVESAMRYRQRILSALAPDTLFDPLMTLYLTDQTSREDVRAVAHSPHVIAFKLYPQGATTNSDAGISHLDALNPILEEMEALDVPLLIHGEVTDPEIDIFDRERIFIERYLEPMSVRFPALRIVLEHITTKDGAHFVRDSRPGIGATITAHHLLFNRNRMLAGGIRPHFYCLPILKREEHRRALLDAATSGNSKFFLGTDSAPHASQTKEAACGCAGCYTARHAMALYATAFDSVGRLDQLESFASFNGPDFYSLPRNVERLKLARHPTTIENSLSYGEDDLIPLLAGETLDWSIEA